MGIGSKFIKGLKRSAKKGTEESVNAGKKAGQGSADNLGRNADAGLDDAFASSTRQSDVNIDKERFAQYLREVKDGKRTPIHDQIRAEQAQQSYGPRVDEAAKVGNPVPTNNGGGDWSNLAQTGIAGGLKAAKYGSLALGAAMGGSAGLYALDQADIITAESVDQAIPPYILHFDIVPDEIPYVGPLVDSVFEMAYSGDPENVKYLRQRISDAGEDADGYRVGVSARISNANAAEEASRGNEANQRAKREQSQTRQEALDGFSNMDFTRLEQQAGVPMDRIQQAATATFASQITDETRRGDFVSAFTNVVGAISGEDQTLNREEALGLLSGSTSIQVGDSDAVSARGYVWGLMNEYNVATGDNQTRLQLLEDALETEQLGLELNLQG